MNLDEVRARIDQLDKEIIRNLNERLEAVLEVGRVKREHDACLYVPAREKQVFDRVLAENNGPLRDEHIRAIYREIMSAALDLEGGLNVAYLGPAGTHTHQAAVERFGQNVNYSPCADFPDVFSQVEKGNAQYGIVPIENSREGSVHAVQDLLTETPLKICSESYMKIHQNLIGKSPIEKITRVYSHPQALGQCAQWLRSNIPHAELVAISSTAAAAHKAGSEEGAAAVGSRMAAELEALDLIAEDIQDASDNTTRFIMLSRAYGPPSGKDKTSIVFGLQHKVGALNHALQLLEDRSVNLLKIQSRPNRQKQWEYHFFVDVEGHADTDEMKETLAAMAENCIFLTVLGAFPQATV